MLVHKKQESYIYEQETATPTPKPVIKADKGLRLKCLILVVMAAIMAVVTTVQSHAIVKAGYDFVEIKRQVAKVEKENELLKLDIAKLRSPQRIEDIATKELGMVVPQNAYYASATLPVHSGSTVPVISKNAGGTETVFSPLHVSKAEASKGR